LVLFYQEKSTAKILNPYFVLSGKRRKKPQRTQREDTKDTKRHPLFLGDCGSEPAMTNNNERTTMNNE
jgi:hypothetical protein